MRKARRADRRSERGWLAVRRLNHTSRCTRTAKISNVTISFVTVQQRVERAEKELSADGITPQLAAIAHNPHAQLPKLIDSSFLTIDSVQGVHQYSVTQIINLAAVVVLRVARAGARASIRPKLT